MLMVSSSVGGDHIMSKRSSYDIGDSGHRGLTAEEEEMQIDVAIAEEADMQLDYPSDGKESDEEDEDQASPHDVNSFEESASEENWKAGCDPRPSAEDLLTTPSLVNDPLVRERGPPSAQQIRYQSSNPENEESESKRFETQELAALRTEIVSRRLSSNTNTHVDTNAAQHRRKYEEKIDAILSIFTSVSDTGKSNAES